MVPNSLRVWFVVHFAVDIIFAIPLLLVPEFTLSVLGWTTVDPMLSRLVGAALMGIGLESLLGRKATVQVFRAMLNLKIIWSLSAIFGIGLSLIQGGPIMGWIFLIIFAAFCCLWTHYRIKLHGTSEE
ncbi:hypothetical protein ACFLZT_05570 [Thermodesulfobacteriota bacterium]